MAPLGWLQAEIHAGVSWSGIRRGLNVADDIALINLGSFLLFDTLIALHGKLFISEG